MSKVLIAEDSGVMRKIILRTLNGLGFNDVVEAADGAIAWDAFQSDHFDLVLSDWNMPNMSGIELLRAIRESGADVPVLMITTESEQSRVVDAIQAGANSYLVKPFDPETLSQKLESIAVTA